MIECEPGDLINLIRANYGRFSITICNDHGNVDWSVNCMSPKSLRVLHSKCAQKQNCSVLASTSMFGDPCPGTHKYLEAHYQCVSAAQSSTTTNRPSPPWLKTSQPIVWSTSTVRSPVLSRLNLTTDLGGGEVAVVAAVTPALSTPPATIRPAGGGSTGTKTSQSPTTFRNKGFENKSVNDDLAIIKTIADRKKGTGSVDSPGPRAPSGGTEDDRTASAGGGNAKEEEEDDGADLFPTQTAVLSGAAAPPGVVVRKDPIGTSVNGGGNVHIDISHACGPSTARNLFWNVTRVGEVNVQPCPGGATGIAKWRCVAIASLTPEQRVHLQQEHQQMLQIQAAQQQPSGGNGGSSGVQSPDDSGSGGKGDISFSSNSVALSDKQSMVGAATWYAYRPDLTQCRSLWLNNLEVRVQQPESSLISIANDLAQVTSSKTLYGGDMLVATKIIQTMSQKMHYDIETIPDQRQREALVSELLNSVVKTGSNLLDQSQHASWLDLSVEDQMRVATSLLTGLEDNAFLLADTILREKHVVQKVKNILLSIRVLETRNFAKSTELFPDSSTERWQVSNDQIELPKAALIENSEGGLVRIVFVAFDRLEQILRPQFSNIQQQQQHAGGAGASSVRAEPSQLHHLDTEGVASTNVAGLGTGNGDRLGVNDGSTIGSSAVGGTGTRTDSASQSETITPRLRLLNSKVISASLGKGRHIQLSQPIRMILRHLRTKNVSNPTCVFWNYIDHAWSEDGCHVEHTNSTHTVCMCNHLTNFALLVDAVDDETQLSLLSNLDDSLLLYIGIAVLVVVVVVALFARKLCHGAVLAKLRNGGPEANAGGLRGGAIDRDPAGLSISAHHGTVAGRLHHHHGVSNNAGVDLHHPTVATAGHHHHHMVHHHLPPPGTGHHLLVADDFHHQQQQHPTNNLHNHHPNNLGSNHHANSNNLVTTTFNNLNGGGGIGGPGNCSPSPPGSGYEHHHPAHHLARLNNNVNVNFNSNNNSSISSSSNSNTNNSVLLTSSSGKGGDDVLVKPFPSYRTNNNQINLLRAANHHAQQQQQQQHHQQQQQQQHRQHQQSAPSANAPSAAVLLQQQQHHHRHHHHQSQAAATAAGAILLQGLGSDGSPSSPSASSLIASTSLITTTHAPVPASSQKISPMGKGSGGGGGGGSLDSSGSDHSSGSTTAAEMVAYNLSGEVGDVGIGTGVSNGDSPGHHLHLHHHQGSIGSSASSGLLVVAAGGNAGGSVSAGTVGTITSSASSNASASVPLLHHHHHHHLHHHLHQHLHPGGAATSASELNAVPIPSKRNL
ncbi:latrophilin Cirl isoform X1 [Anopheles maculipalpis]|uniref:latrophilin Cirl isoform X1 n=1 Tax=Anopheles maculipalpis TaxID=1496333 RepID=UPI002159A98E|nr:latrophilin Cirl isoform X1 [Anopheles maculipalpis]